MNKSSKFIASVAVIAFAVVIQAENVEASIKQEKCFGVVKAGKNDCKAADGSHSCAGYSKNDGQDADWIMLPEGTCDRIIGASMKPPEKKRDH